MRGLKAEESDGAWWDGKGWGGAGVGREGEGPLRNPGDP